MDYATAGVVNCSCWIHICQPIMLSFT